jgi:hypothetical protein
MGQRVGLKHLLGDEDVVQIVKGDKPVNPKPQILNPNKPFTLNP